MRACDSQKLQPELAAPPEARASNWVNETSHTSISLFLMCVCVSFALKGLICCVNRVGFSSLPVFRCRAVVTTKTFAKRMNLFPTSRLEFSKNTKKTASQRYCSCEPVMTVLSLMTSSKYRTSLVPVEVERDKHVDPIRSCQFLSVEKNDYTCT